MESLKEIVSKEKLLEFFPLKEDYYHEYDLVESISEGVYTSVIKAYKKSTESWVAIKRYRIEDIIGNVEECESLLT